MLDRLIDFLLSCLGLFKFWIVLAPYEQGVLVRLGKFIRVLDPGMHWVIPLNIDHVYYEHVVPRTHELRPESVTSADGKSVSFTAVITFQVRRVEKALLEVEDVGHAVVDACCGEIGRVLRSATWSEMMDESMLEKLTSACRKKAFKWGIEVIQVQLAGIAIARNIRLIQN
jgi:regulator of protease activity HflC (stomatin/prohibitin superfamily)